MAMSTATPVVEVLEMVQIQGNAYSYNVVKDVIVKTDKAFAIIEPTLARTLKNK